MEILFVSDMHRSAEYESSILELLNKLCDDCPVITVRHINVLEESLFDNNDYDKELVLDELEDISVIESFNDKLMSYSPRFVVFCGLTYKLLTNTSLKEAKTSRFRLADTNAYVINSLDFVSKNKKVFKATKERINKLIHKNISSTPYILCDTLEKVDKAINACKSTRYAFMDYETTGFNWYDGYTKKKDHPTCIGLSHQPGFCYIIPLLHKDSPFTADEYTLIKDKLIDGIFSNRKVIKVCQNTQFEMFFTKSFFTEKLRGEWHDIMLMHQIYDETLSHGLKDMTKLYFPKFAGYEESVGKNNWKELPLNKLAWYCAIDCDMTARLFHVFSKWLIEDEDSQQYLVYRNIQSTALNVVNGASYRGSKIDIDTLVDIRDRMTMAMEHKLIQVMDYPVLKKYNIKKSKAIKEAALELVREKLKAAKARSKTVKSAMITNYENKLKAIKAGKSAYNKLVKGEEVETVFSVKTDQGEWPYKTVNFNSPMQLQDLYYHSPHGFKFDPKINFKGEKEYTTDSKYLKLLFYQFKRESHPHTNFMNLYFAYRSLKKTLKTFYGGIYDNSDYNNMCHTSFKLAGAKTGRMSSANPNFQNLAARSHYDDPDATYCTEYVRKLFINYSDDYVMLQADYSQAELRVIANVSNDENMINAYVNEVDLHMLTACKIYGSTPEEFYSRPDAKYERNQAKSANFGLVFGAGDITYRDYISSRSGEILTDEEIELHKAAVFGTYPKLKQWHKDAISLGRKQGYTRTMLGRKRQLKFINSNNSFMRAKDERVAINSPIQGSAGELAIFCIGLLEYRLPKEVILFNTVHDSVFYYVPKNILAYTVKIIKETCENPPIDRYFNKQLGKVNMKLDFSISTISWGEMKEYEYNDIINNKIKF